MPENNSIDKKMLLLLDRLKDYTIIRYDVDFCRAIGLEKQNLVNIRKGRNHFTIDHVHNAIKHFKLDANWMFNDTEEMFLFNTPKSTLLTKTN